MFKNFKLDGFNFETSYIGEEESFVFVDKDENWIEIIHDNRSNGFIVQYVYNASTVCVEYYNEAEAGDVFMQKEIKKNIKKLWEQYSY